MRAAFVALLLGVFWFRAGWAAETPMIDGGNRFGQVRFYQPAEGRPLEGLVALVSDRQGWDAAADALARHLVDGGQAVLGIDLATYAIALGQDRGDCSWVNADFEFLSRKVEKELPFSEFRPPVILGLGAGAGVAYAASVQVLPNTFAGGVGLRFTPAFDVGRRLCLPTEPAVPGQPVRYAPAPGHDTPWLFAPAPDFAAPGGAARRFAAAMPQAHLIQAQVQNQAQVLNQAGDAAAADEAFRRIRELDATRSQLAGLPIVEVPPPDAPAGPHPLVIFYSGDGGWRDIDSQIGGYLAEQGFFVVGFDSLRYFWREKEPREMAADLDTLIRHYADRSGGRGVILVGYSFGADLLPFIVNRMAPDTRGQVKLISLLGIAEHASFEIRLDGILGAENEDGPPTVPELARINDIPVQCVYGFDETGSACTDKALDKIVDRVEMSGGHHFDGDYHRVANLIVTAAKGKVGE